MIKREADFTTIQERRRRRISSTTAATKMIIEEAAAASSSTSTSNWSKLTKDPRIVRVSRAFGGKDRHSKVCTVKGLRDRRVRLSVPTAIQLYDLQDRLGLSQPSKVVDWLLNAAKHEIDDLPPLQIPQGIFCQNPHPSSNFLDFGANSESNKLSDDSLIKQYHGHPTLWGKSRCLPCETSGRGENWARNEVNMNQGAYVPDQSSLLLSSSLPSTFLDTSASQYNPFVRWDPSHLTLSQPAWRSRELTADQGPEDMNNFGFVPMAPSAFSVVIPSSGSHPILVHDQPEMSTIQSYFPLQISSMSHKFDPRQMNYQTSLLSNCSLSTQTVSSSTTSSTQSLRPFHFMTMAHDTSILPLLNNSASDQQKHS